MSAVTAAAGGTTSCSAMSVMVNRLGAVPETTDPRTQRDRDEKNDQVDPDAVQHPIGPGSARCEVGVGSVRPTLAQFSGEGGHDGLEAAVVGGGDAQLALVARSAVHDVAHVPQFGRAVQRLGDRR